MILSWRIWHSAPTRLIQLTDYSQRNEVAPTSDTPLNRREARRRLGEYVLVARLSEDALGTVYRAIHVRDGRFARLRVLGSSELPPARVLRAISRMEPVHKKHSVHPPGRRETLSIADGKPYLAWHETNGWTLDAVLESARGRGAVLPIDGALRIVAGVAAALEHVRSNAAEGEPAHHGLLWPGFVTISRNAEVWVRGFGLASTVFPWLHQPSLAQLLGPYLAPEVRSNGAFGEQSDIYSLGVLLAELLTVREASLSGPPEFLPDDPFSEDVGRLLKTLLAEPAARLRSVRAVRLRLQKLLEDCPYERSNADLALDLDELLMPENGARSSTGTVAARRLRSPHRPWPGSFEPGATSRTWVLRIAASLAAVLLLAAVDLAVRKREPSRAIAPAPQKSFASHLAERPSLPAVSSIGPGEELRDSSLAASSVSAPEVHLSVHRPSRTALRQERHLAQVWRLRAALSRVSAEQIDAADLAAEAFRAGRISENEGERLLAVRRPRQAREAFERAAELYNQAEDLSHQERARVIRISLRNAEGPAPGSF